jgi:hypothetical protein
MLNLAKNPSGIFGNVMRAALAILFALSGILPAFGQVGQQETKAFATQSAILTFDQNALRVSPVRGFQALELPDCDRMVEMPGVPDLPVHQLRLLLPAGATATSARVVKVQENRLPGKYRVYPVQPVVRPGETPTTFVEGLPEIYNSTNSYPAKRVELVTTQQIRGYSIATVMVWPVRYVGASDDVHISPRMEIEVEFSLDGSKPPPVLHSKQLDHFSRMVRGLAHNPGDEAKSRPHVRGRPDLNSESTAERRRIMETSNARRYVPKATDISPDSEPTAAPTNDDDTTPNPKTGPGVVALSSATYTVDQNGGSLTVSAVRLGGMDGAASVEYATSDGTALDGTHYTAASGTLTWKDQEEGPKTFTVPIIDNTGNAASDKTFTVSLSNAYGSSLDTPSSAMVTILGNVVMPTSSAEYLIITSDALASSFQALADHRASFNGLSTQIITTESIISTYDGTRPDGGTDTQTKIRNCIKAYVASNDTLYVVLGGDNTIVPDRDTTSTVNTSEGPETETTIPTDFYYAGLDGTWDDNANGTYGEVGEGDLGADVIVGRIPVRSTTHVDAYVNKLIAYENNPPAALLDKMMFSGYFLWDTYSGSDRPSDLQNDGHLEFQDANHPTVSDAEMWMRRMFRDRVKAYDWTPSTLGYMFDTLTSWDGTTAGDYAASPANLVTRYNEGWNFVLNDTHGNTGILSAEGGNFGTANAASLTNLTAFFRTGACLSGGFDAGEPSMSEAMLRNPNGGALIYLGGARYGWGWPDEPPAENTTYGGPSAQYIQDWLTEVFENKNTVSGSSYYTAKALKAGSAAADGSYRWIYFSENLQGDPLVRIYGIADQGLYYSTDTFTESTSNDGSIGNTMIITLFDDTFTGVNGTDVGANITVENLPAGLTAEFMKDSDTQLTVTLNGNASSHGEGSSVTNLSFTFLDAAFTGGDASALADSTKSDLVVDFNDLILAEDFEDSSELPTGWSQVYVTNTVDWAVQTGGYTGGSHPDTAHSGTKNMTLYVNNNSDHKTRLLTPVFDSSSFTNVILNFWHTQEKWVNDQDELNVFYSANGGSSWVWIAGYSNSIASWTEHNLDLPATSTNSLVAFEGNAKYGYGVCIDDVAFYGQGAEIPVNSTGILSFASSTYSVSEDGASVHVYVTRTSGSNDAVSVDYSTVDGTAAAGTDYTTTTGTLDWDDGSMITNHFVVPITDNSLFSGDRAFAVRLHNPDGGASLGLITNATVTIQEDEVLPGVPTGLDAVQAVNQIDLSWSSASNATSYEVKRSSVQGPPYETVGTPALTSFSDTTVTNGETYYYVVSSASAAGESGNSDELAVVLLQALPFTEDFDSAGMATAIGMVDGQNGWTGGSNALVQAGESHGGVNALSIAEDSASLDVLNGSNVVAVSFWIKPVAGAEPEPASLSSNSTAVIWVGTNQHVMVYSNTTAVTLPATVVPDQWCHMEANIDYAAGTWDLAIDGTNAATGLGVYSNKSGFIGIEFDNTSATATYVDDLNITSVLAALTDYENWLVDHYGDAGVDDSQVVSNGVNTIREAYIIGLDPEDPGSVFSVSGIEAQSGAVVTWGGVSGRLYNVYWSSNLLEGADGFLLIRSNVLGNAGSMSVTDSVHSADNAGFYRIDVQLDE